MGISKPVDQYSYQSSSEKRWVIQRLTIGQHTGGKKVSVKCSAINELLYHTANHKNKGPLQQKVQKDGKSQMSEMTRVKQYLLDMTGPLQS